MLQDGVTIEEELTPPTTEEIYESPVPLQPESVYLWEHFDDPAQFDKRWVRSAAKKEGTSEDISKYDGQWAVEAGEKDPLPGDLSLVLKSKAKHAAIATKLIRPFIFTGQKPLVIQYEVNFQEGQECGGAYLKLLSEGADTAQLNSFRDSTPYTIMFGPDKCGNEHKLHLIFRHVNPLNGSTSEKHLTKKPDERIDELFRDKRAHLYTLVLRPSGTYEVRVDGKPLISGSLLEDFEPPVNPPDEIDDPLDKRPVDWDDREKIPEEGAIKPEEWDEEAPAQLPDTEATMPAGWLEHEHPMVPDPTAEKPTDWDVEMDGEWEAPLVDNSACVDAAGCGPWEPPLVPNPAYRGKWRAPLVPNPAYRGTWRPRRIPNPLYFKDERPFRSLKPVAALGFELWSMSSGMLFDNVLITEGEATADQLARDTWERRRAIEQARSVSLWGRVLRWTRGRPGLWAAYAVWCLAPFLAYALHMRTRLRQVGWPLELDVLLAGQPDYSVAGDSRRTTLDVGRVRSGARLTRSASALLLLRVFAI